VDSVKILPLAKRLNLSRTSFYWFFKDRDELLSSLISLWREKNTGNMIKQSEANAESLTEAMLNVFDCWVDKTLFDSPLEFAVRSWALQSSEILDEVRRADQTRLEALAKIFIRFGHAEQAADVRARTTYLVQIGYISMQSQEDISTRMKRIPEYIAIYTGQMPQKKELHRFFSRHGYKPD
jgi:AcrR family transcriptional regulator